jgi:hypothetical protein
VYHALQALLWVLCLSSVLTVWASVNAFRESRRATTFDDTTSQGTSAAAITSQGNAAAATTIQGTATTTIVLQKKRFTNAQTGLHVALWIASTLALFLLAVAVSSEYKYWFSDYYNEYSYSYPYNTAEVIFSLAVVCLVWLVSTVYICLRVCSVAVYPVAVLAADVVFLVLTMVSAGVANALGGVNCSGFTAAGDSIQNAGFPACNTFVAGVAFIWLSMVAYIVLLVLNVLAVVQTTAMNIQQVNFTSQGQGHNIEVVVGGGDGTNGSTNTRTGTTEYELRGPDAAPPHAPPIVSDATPAKMGY